MSKCKDHLGQEYDSFKEMAEAWNIPFRTFSSRLYRQWDLEQILTTPIKSKGDRFCRDHLGCQYKSVKEMTDAWNIPYGIFKNRERKNWNLEKALTEPIKKHNNAKPCQDHLGREYDSITEMANAWNIDCVLLRNRLEVNWDVERALTEPNRNDQSKVYTDHQGNQYRSIPEMAKAYGLKPNTLYFRLSKGWDIRTALTTKLKGTCQDHNGTEYPSLKAMCKAYGISTDTFRYRYENLGWDLEKALSASLPTHTVTDHKGNSYPNVKAMAEAYGLTASVVQNRIKYGWNKERMLTTPLNDNHTVYDHKGNAFPSKRAMAKAYGIPINVFNERLKRNWSLETALRVPVGGITSLPPRMCKDHKGKIYSTRTAMAEAYGISYRLLVDRLAAGWSLEKALTAPIGQRDTAPCYQCKDHLGKKYPSKKAMAEAYGLTYHQMIKRLEANWTLEEALTAGHKELMHFQGGCKDHKGNKYPSKAAMAKAYGIPESTFRRRISRGWSLEKALTTPICCIIREEQIKMTKQRKGHN